MTADAVNAILPPAAEPETTRSSWSSSHPQLRYVAGRLVQAAVVLLIVTLVVFLLSRVSGDPALLIAPPSASAEDIEAISANLGLDKPLPTQMVNYLGDSLRGDLGESHRFRAPVRELIVDALPHTVQLAVVAFLFGSIPGAALGIFAGLRAGTWFDALARGISLVGQSVPSFWLGMMLVLVFSVRLGALPTFGTGTPQHLILPAVALGAFPLAAITRLTRSATLEVLRTDHIRFTRSRGVSNRVFLIHLLRNVSLPVVTLSGIQLANLLSGSIIIETLFAWPGIGQLAVQGIVSRDFPVVQGVVLVGTTMFVLLNLAVDLSYSWLDPRVRRGNHGR